MQIQPISSPSPLAAPAINRSAGLRFGYKSVIKTLWLQGELPEVKRGLYGFPLTRKNISNEHLEPYCIHHDNTLSNVALADRYLNNLRGDKPLRDFLTFEQARAYYEQFRGVKVQGFDGDTYIKQGLERCKRLGILSQSTKK